MGRFVKCLNPPASRWLLVCGVLGGGVAAEPNPQAPANPKDELSSAERERAVEELRELLQQNYVFPVVAKQIADHLDERWAGGAYEACDTAERFASALTEDLRWVNDDRHLAVWPVSPTAPREGGLDRDFARFRGRESNYGFEEARVLAGNVGYLRMSSFSLDEMYDEASEAAARAMAFLANSDALIFDLRDNPGGGARLIRFLSSYLFDEEPVHLNDYYFRTSGQTLEYWTLEEVPGARMPDVDVYILLNRGTFSASESFAYNLKHLSRATIVGQRSGGGSHGGQTHPLGERFETYVPFSRSVHPVTKTDFEGVGVVPDLKTSPGKELQVAHRQAVQRLRQADPAGPDVAHYERILEALKDR